MKLKTIFTSTSTSLLVAMLLMTNSCAPTTPTSRIAKNPSIFGKLTDSDKQLAKLGQIERGMHKDGVLIAWGRPDGVTSGSNDGKSFEKWTYTIASPVYSDRFRSFGAYGYGRISHGRACWQGGGFGMDFGPEVYYVQRTVASVEFDQYNKVSNWERRK
ncbi:MAG: hypothetical protein ACI9SQ_000726 [Rubritalea sp.]|jgi:hypothetical protein